jgi:hypothetical protein
MFHWPLSYKYKHVLQSLIMLHTITLHSVRNHRHHYHHHHHWQNGPFWALAFLRRFCQIHPVFTSFDFATILLQSKFVSLVSNPQPGGPGPCIYVPQWQCVPVILPGTGFTFPCLLGLAGLRWRYSNLPPRGMCQKSVFLNNSLYILWFCSPIRILSSFTTDAHSSILFILSPSFRFHLS